MISRVFALCVLFAALLVVLAEPIAEKRADPIGSIVSEASTALGGATSVAGSVFSEATSAVGGAYTYVTSVGGSAYTVVTAQGSYYSIATNAAGSAYSVAASAVASATGSPNAAHGLRADWVLSFPLFATLLAVMGGVFMGVVVVF